MFEARAEVMLARLLLDQQFWCWGQDLGHEGGDGLRRFGLTLERDSNLTRGSRYRGATTAEARVTLWAFGLLWEGEAGGLAIWRDDARVRLTTHAVDTGAVRGARDLFVHPCPRGPAERRQALLLAAALMRWMAEYERWALVTLGLDHRRAVAAAWSRSVCGPSEVPATWLRLASAAEDVAFTRRPVASMPSGD